MTIVEKIKALLAKAASTDSQHEAEAFLRKAHELMEKHQLEAGDLETDDPIHKTAGARANGGASPDWDFQLMFAVAKYFGCKGIQYWSQKKLDGTYVRSGEYVMWIVGRESARITAVEMHKYLVKTVRRLGRENATPNQKADTLSRRIGRALQIRINEMCPDEPTAETPAGKNALVTLNGTLAKFQELFPDSKPMGGTILTSANAEKLAAGIGLNLQTGHSATLALK
jgi:hypothetical protein